MLLDADQEACEVISIGRLYMDASIWTLLSDLGGPDARNIYSRSCHALFSILNIFSVDIFDYFRIVFKLVRVPSKSPSISP